MSIFRKLVSFLKCESGVAAVEMGLFAPPLIIGVVLMADIGLAVEARMELDRNVRAGVQAAMSNVSDLEAIKGVVLASANGSEAISVAVGKTCTCGSAAASCTSWCAPEVPPSVFINISATEAYSGLMLPALTLESKTHVQLR
ncbi:TadE/TadG family type IV pilus assembly protein [Microbaculum sp. FT89]|uniref:TadE/TadG family type IV pilus assembly protein n=1 Tax=Microbaculum sp. FT89 TaxID=3447298 RepID=UPI003F52D1DD